MIDIGSGREIEIMSFYIFQHKWIINDDSSAGFLSDCEWDDLQQPADGHAFPSALLGFLTPCILLAAVV